MSATNIITDSTGKIRVVHGYGCDLKGCARCYSEDMGYFDFIAGRIELSAEQTLCEGDACPMFLEGSVEDERVYRCPCCGRLVRF